MDLKIQKLDNLLQYILTVAGQNDYLNRELKMIHLIKYVYLVDLAYAKSHNGETYTGLTWAFHHFGPWSVECFKRIEPALNAISAHRKVVESPKYDDFIRWHIDDYEMFEQLNDQMELDVAGAVQKYVREFGNDTYGLLDFVYKTEPMLRAAPEELLDFRHAVVTSHKMEDTGSKTELTVRQKKKQRQKILAFKEQLNRQLDEKIKIQKTGVCPLPPRYDDVYFEGLVKLDEAAGNPPIEGEYVAVFSDDVWKSKARHDDELS